MKPRYQSGNQMAQDGIRSIQAQKDSRPSPPSGRNYGTARVWINSSVSSTAVRNDRSGIRARPALTLP
ncbi:hypothetical protein HNY73_022978 [Argiope bruennichi]|uniref:Uncharacterized protein n=1 Tax=Argiope bruennichi TaxID=94029 RepID=A0A8T0E485_ARGBR|nr:hypothetical protein HNY73_022978 [Argiope bruennichi]